MASLSSLLPSSVYVPMKDIQPMEIGNGHDAYFLWQAFPALRNTVFDIELSYDAVAASNFVKSHPYLPIYVISVYLVGIFGGQYYMKDKKPYDLKFPLAYWNLFLAIFSFIGMVRTVPTLLYFMTQMTMKEISCTPYWTTHGAGEVGLWCAAFAASKFFELFDTMFIVLRKKNLMFLHWYHHVTVLLFTYYACFFEHAGFFFVGMNYTVHSFMYFYYYLMAFKAIPKWFKPQWITMGQISQMIVGVTTGLASYYYKFYGTCPGASKELIIAGFIMYSSYLYLFVKFAVNRFILKKPAGKKPLKKTEEVKSQ